MHRNKSVSLGLLLALLIIWTQVRPGVAARLATEDRLPGESATQGQTTNGKPADGGGILLNFKEVDILQIIDLMSDLTGKNFLVDEKVRGKVTVIAPKPVNINEAYNVFLSILEVQGFTVVPQGPIIKIIPSREVKESPLPTTIDGAGQLSADSDEFVTQLIPLKHADANEIRGLLSALVSKESSLLAYAPTNTLILTEVASNIARLLKIIRALDVEAPSSILKVITLQYASAEQLASSLQSALEGLAATGSAASGESPAQQARRRRSTRRTTTQPLQRAPIAPKMIADSRTNSLVVIATPGDMAAVEDLIAKLDVPTPEGRGQIHVYYLAHANAEELAQVLTAQATDISRTTTTAAAAPGQQGRPPQAGRRAPPTQSGTGPLGITITADKPTNSLVITAPPEAYTVIREIIEKLDIRRSQVLVEALFAEVTLSRAEQFGVEWRVIDEPNGTQVFTSSTGSGQTGVLGALTANPLTSVPGFLIGALRNTITIGNNQIFNIPAVLRAFQGDTDVNILATPNLLTTDNEEAEIIIGEERPFLRTAQDSPTSGTQAGFSTTRSFEFRDVGITLRLTPQISQGKTVRLNLFIELTSFSSEAQGEVGAVTTSKRTAQTTVIVDDSQTIVIGGLLQEDNDQAQTQVPCLGNVPLLGWAFKQTSKTKNKNNLLLFITPHILNTPSDIARITEHKRQQSARAPEIEEQLQRQQPPENLELLLN